MKRREKTSSTRKNHQTKNHKSILDEALHVKHQVQLISPLNYKSYNKCNDISKLPSVCNFTIPCSTITEEHRMYDCIWYIHDHLQFVLCKQTLLILNASNKLFISNHDIEVMADSFELTSMELGNLMIEGKLYSFYMKFHSNHIGNFVLTLLVHYQKPNYKYSIKDINLLPKKGE